jgi:hypothetical protein
MHIHKHPKNRSSSVNHGSEETSAADIVLREARNLHRAVNADSLARSLPVLRRLLASGVLQGIALPELHRSRDTVVQRKHILRMLAIEAGFASWEAYRPALSRMKASELPHFDIARHDAGQLNHWFSTLDEAKAYAASHGGRAMAVGQQAVVLIGA